MNKTLKYYIVTFFKLWAVFFVLGVVVGSLEYITLVWKTGLFSILTTGLIALTIKYCPTYAQLHWGIKKKKEN